MTSMPFTDLAALDAALQDLGTLLAHRGERFELCAIGGAAFLMQEPERFHSTVDVDIAAQVTSDGSLVAPAPLPAPLEQAVHEIAGVRLPDGFLTRAQRRDYGGLVLHVASRTDLLRLKLLAATERRGHHGERHFDDIERARPTPAEIQDAAAWVRARLTDPLVFHDRLEALVERLRAGRE